MRLPVPGEIITDLCTIDANGAHHQTHGEVTEVWPGDGPEGVGAVTIKDGNWTALVPTWCFTEGYTRWPCAEHAA